MKVPLKTTNDNKNDVEYMYEKFLQMKSMKEYEVILMLRFQFNSS